MPDGLRLPSVGISLSGTCGVRDHAVLLAGALAGDGAAQELYWLWRSEGGRRRASGEIHAWTRELAAQLDRDRPDAIVLHYSAFAYSYRGVPLFVLPVLRALRSAGVPIITIAHELVYPWRLGGWRGKVWAVSQRALLIELVRSSAALLVTVDFMAQWLRSRAWLPNREVAVVPVFSNLPPSNAVPPPDRARKRLGLFGYAYQGAAVDAVLGAVRLLRDRRVETELALLGAPGRASAAGERWLGAARRAGVEGSLSFDGPLPAQALADALARCDILVFPDAAGPSPRKGTLAASLASGRPVVAVAGHTPWPEPIEARALELVTPSAAALADAIAGLLVDDRRREALGARGRAFAEAEMSVGRTAQAVTALLAGVRGGRSR